MSNSDWMADLAAARNADWNRRVIDLLSTMDVPSMRLDITLPQNVAWLIRNLGIRNSKVEGFLDLVDMLKVTLAKMENK